MVNSEVFGVKLNKCETCKYWTKLPPNPKLPIGSTSQGECRGGPPQIVAIPTPVRTASGTQVQVQITTMFPNTPPDEFCRNWSPRLN